MLVLAREGDSAVAELRARAPGYVRQVRPRDLSRAGWRYVAGQPEEACAVADGQVIPCRDIAAVLCRLPGVAIADLADIQAVDRAYVAAEMHAFLLAWLTQFRGMRFNAPTPGSLCGPGWHEMKWTLAAARAGLPVAKTRRTLGGPASSPPAPASRQTVQATVVGREIFGTAVTELADHARRLAAACKLALLGVRFVRDAGRWQFAAADPCPALDAASAAAVVRIALNESGARRWVA
jgi:hypothetical protein